MLKILIYRIVFLTLIWQQCLSSFADEVSYVDCKKSNILNVIYYFTDNEVSDAILSSENVIHSCPYQENIIDIKVLHIFFKYIHKDYEEIDDLVVNFQKLYPYNHNIPYLLYIQGLGKVKTVSSYKKNIKDIFNAKKIFLSLKTKYPNSPYFEFANQQLKYIDDQIMLFHLSIADFYYDRRLMTSALKKYQDILQDQSAGISVNDKAFVEDRIFNIINNVIIVPKM